MSQFSFQLEISKVFMLIPFLVARKGLISTQGLGLKDIGLEFL